MDGLSFVLGFVVGVLVVFGLEPFYNWAKATVKRLREGSA